MKDVLGVPICYTVHSFISVSLVTNLQNTYNLRRKVVVIKDLGLPHPLFFYVIFD